MIAFLRTSSTVALLLSAFACGGDEIAPTMTEVERNVFSVSCVFSSCHLGPAPRAGLDLGTPAHAKIVNVDSSEKAGAKLVVPGDPDASFLLDKLLGRNLPAAPIGEAETTSMPPGGIRLDAELIDLVRRWIAAGAPND